MSPELRRARALAVWLLLGPVLAWPSFALEGDVRDDEQPIAGASVRWQGTAVAVHTDAAGHFRLPPGRGFLTATEPGYRIAHVPASTRHLTLRPLPEADHPDYAWVDPHPDPAHTANCGNCHTGIYREWAGSSHASSAHNPKFLAFFERDGPAWSPGVDAPAATAVCAGCHVPTLSSPALDYDPRPAEGVARDGIHCDYCHKVHEAPTDRLGTRFGKDGLFLLRPASGDLLSFGPLPDAVRPGESFGHAPLYRRSEYCASCHEGILFGIHGYATYSEWKASSAARAGQQCQDCHMRPSGATNIAPGHGGIQRDPHTLSSHRFPGGERTMLQSSLALTVRVHRSDREVRVDVEVLAHHVGHRVPTGFPQRHLILVVEGIAGGRPVEPFAGPRLSSEAGDMKGRAGVLYGKLQEDTRLHPDQPALNAFRFPAQTTRVEVMLLYRRFWHDLAARRAWTDNDLLIERQTIAVKDVQR